jgi:hypothetical protein
MELSSVKEEIVRRSMPCIVEPVIFVILPERSTHVRLEILYIGISAEYDISISGYGAIEEIFIGEGISIVFRTVLRLSRSTVDNIIVD